MRMIIARNQFDQSGNLLAYARDWYDLSSVETRSVSPSCPHGRPEGL